MLPLSKRNLFPKQLNDCVKCKRFAKLFLFHIERNVSNRSEPKAGQFSTWTTDLLQTHIQNMYILFSINNAGHIYHVHYCSPHTISDTDTLKLCTGTDPQDEAERKLQRFWILFLHHLFLFAEVFRSVSELKLCFPLFHYRIISGAT